MTPLTRRAVVGLAGTAALALLASCSDKNNGAGPGGAGSDVNTYVAGLPSWSAFAPAVPDQDAAPAGGPTFFQDTVAQDSSATDTLNKYTVRPNVVYVCDSTPFSITKTPAQLVMYSPPTDILFPGAMIQGKSHKASLGSLAPLTINERAPINVSIPSLSTANNFRTVTTVNQSAVGSAIGDMVGSAVKDSLNTANTSFFQIQTFHSEADFALGIGLSGKYLGWKAKTQANLSSKVSQTIISVQFQERMFDVVVAPPSTPAGWFTSAFTPAKLQEQVTLNRMGPDNLPLYVSKVTYGRMMMFTLKSTASESDLKTIINLSYNALGNGAAASFSDRQRNILNSSQIDVFSIGGVDSATAAMIRSGDWRSYFTGSAPLNKAAPLVYEMRNIGDESVANVAETTNYYVRSCTELSSVRGQFNFLGGQATSAPVAVPFETKLADVNNDGISDLIYNHRDANTNVVAVSLGSGSGAFGAPTVYTSNQAVPSGGWATYQLSVADITGDGRADLIWTNTSAAMNVYTAVAQAGGGFTFDAAQQLAASGYNTSWRPEVGDFDNDGDLDLLFNLVQSGQTNRSVLAVSKGDGTFDTLTAPIVHSTSTGWTPAYLTYVGDLNKDGRADLFWNSVPGIDQPNRTWSAVNQAGGWQAAASKDHSTSCCWAGYKPVVGDFNGDQVPDIIWYNPVSAGPVHGFLGNGSGGWTQKPLQYVSGVGGSTPIAADINGDGKTDIIWQKLTTTSASVRTGLSDGTATFTLAPVEQKHPASDSFNNATTLVGDVNGDGRMDIVWVIPGATTTVYVGLALP
jgi:Thiol-activated cytolysin/FG-GAP-like repeat/FG-GAP repeat